MASATAWLVPPSRSSTPIPFAVEAAWIRPLLALPWSWAPARRRTDVTRRRQPVGKHEHVQPAALRREASCTPTQTSGCRRAASHHRRSTDRDRDPRIPRADAIVLEPAATRRARPAGEPGQPAPLVRDLRGPIGNPDRRPWTSGPTRALDRGRRPARGASRGLARRTRHRS